MKQSEQSVQLRIQGMTCGHCESRVQAALAAIPGVVAAKANHARGLATLVYDPQAQSLQALEELARAALAEAGYTVAGLVDDKGKAPDGRAQTALSLAVAFALIAVFLLLNSQGWFNFIPTIDSSFGLAMLFVAGLLTSLHCVAMCGGIALSQQTKAGAGRRETTLRGVQYHLGRVISYTVLGGVVGGLGSVIALSPLGKGILAGLAGLFMVLLGLRMLGYLPRLGALRLPGIHRLVPPRAFASIRKRGPFFVGLLNGFMPCGPLQTMQLYALGTGSILLGALSMFLFSLGTVPLMFAFGALSQFFSKRWQFRLVKASSVLVVFFGLVMAGRALELSGASGMVQSWLAAGSSAPTAPAAPTAVAAPASGTTAIVRDGVQYVSFTLKPNSYAPITVQKGLPVEWTIEAPAGSLNGCNREIVVPGLNLSKKLSQGSNLIRFTPQESGIINYTCWMGMISSSIKVVDQLPTENASLPASPPSGQGGVPEGFGTERGSGSGGSQGGGCAMGCCGYPAQP